MAKQTPKIAGYPVKAFSEVTLVGREKERAILRHAIANGNFPQSLLLTGGEGVGKRRLALWTAKALLCTESAESGPCDRCQDCHLVDLLQHPDLHIYAPHTSVGSGSAEQQIDKVEDEREQYLASLRGNALFGPPAPGSAYYVATARSIAHKATHKAFRERGRKVFILCDVDRLTPHEGATEASNAMLKILEEPPPGTHFVLTAPSRHALLGTIRSRVTEMRIAPLSADEVREILANTLGQEALGDAKIQEALALSRGSVTQLRNWLNAEWQETRTQALEVIAAALKNDAFSRYETVDAQGFKGARGEFSFLLGQVQGLCYEAAKWISSRENPPLDVDPGVKTLMQAAQVPDQAWPKVLRACMEARSRARGNANPQLVLHQLLNAMNKALNP